MTVPAGVTDPGQRVIERFLGIRRDDIVTQGTHRRERVEPQALVLDG